MQRWRPVSTRIPACIAEGKWARAHARTQEISLGLSLCPLFIFAKHCVLRCDTVQLTKMHLFSRVPGNA
jgi:hypothetical protein